MANDSKKEVQKTSLLGQILSIETLLLLMGIATLTYGIATDMTMSIFWGCVIIPGVFILRHVRKTDWAKHWEEMEAEHKEGEAREAMRRKASEEARTADDEKQ